MAKQLSKNTTIIGVDEVGMGSLAGPVVVCAVSISARYKIGDFGVTDSKKLSPKQRETCVTKIKKLNIKYQIALCHPKTIDKLNIYQASRKAMRRALTPLIPLIDKGESRGIVLVDGNKKIPNLAFPQQAIINGDQKVFAIAAASILAKVYRDKMMFKYSKKYPQYGFERHKGYGTALHRAMFARYGPCTLHRKSFTIRAL